MFKERAGLPVVNGERMGVGREERGYLIILQYHPLRVNYYITLVQAECVM